LKSEKPSSSKGSLFAAGCDSKLIKFSTAGAGLITYYCYLDGGSFLSTYYYVSFFSFYSLLYFRSSFLFCLAPFSSSLSYSSSSTSSFSYPPNLAMNFSNLPLSVLKRVTGSAPILGSTHFFYKYLSLINVSTSLGDAFCPGFW